jgi:hypothetical protein
MPVVVANCPRCKSKNMTFDLSADVLTGVKHDWQTHYEVFGVCRNCSKPTISSAVSFFRAHQSGRISLRGAYLSFCSSR